MHESAASTVLDKRPFSPEVVRPNLDFARQLHQNFDPELRSLYGLSPVQNRPHARRKTRTLGEEFFKLESPLEVMEYNRSMMNVWLYDVVRSAATEAEIKRAYDIFTDCQRNSERPGVRRDALTFEGFVELKTIVDEAIPPEQVELFRASLIYGDLGKAVKVQEYAHHQLGYNGANHDIALTHIMRDPEAVAECMPSLLTFSEAEQTQLLTMQESGVHLGQYQKFEILPRQLEPFVDLPARTQDMILLNGLFDIAGAEGHATQNGSGTLTQSTFEAFKKARNSFKDLPPEVEAASVKTKSLHCYKTYLEARNQEYGFDLETSKGEALARFVSMFRVLKPEEIAKVSDVFDAELGPATQQLLIDCLTQTGYEDHGSVWYEYGPALARNILQKMKLEGCTFEEALTHAMTTVARLHSATRKLVQPGQVLTVGASLVAQAAEDDWGDVLSQRIIVRSAGEREAVANLEPVPEPAIQEYVDNLDHLDNSTGQTLFIGVGGGSDCDFARFAAEHLVRSPNAPVVSYPGVKAADIQGARQLSQHVFLASAETTFTGSRKRCFEPFAAEGGPCYIIAESDDGQPIDLAAELAIITRHAQGAGQLITQIITVDSGGDIYTPAAYGFRRDHRMLDATEALEAEFNIQRSTSLVMLPGADADHTLPEVTESLPIRGYQLTPQEMQTFVAEREARGWPTAKETEYSQMENTAILAYRRELAGRPPAAEPLQLPASQLRTRPAYTVTSSSMSLVTTVPNNLLRKRILQAA